MLKPDKNKRYSGLLRFGGEFYVECVMTGEMVKDMDEEMSNVEISFQCDICLEGMSAVMLGGFGLL